MNWKELVSSKRIPSRENDDNLSLEIAYESDYRRIVKSSSFRRLQDKTQVFPLDRSDFVRTRLTHSLEVAMISRDILNDVTRRLSDKGIEVEELHASLRLLECAALIHDIGNPPFGHFGEDSIRIWFENNLNKFPEIKNLPPQQLQDYLKFEGNAQTIRVLTKLHDYNGSSNVGMRLTASVLDSVIKYTANSLSMDKSNVVSKKIGYFYSEKDIFKQIKETTGTMDMRHPLVYLLEAADDISYTFSDLEDGFKYGMFSLADLKDYLGYDLVDHTIFQSSLSNEEQMQKFIRTYQHKTFKMIARIYVDHYDEIMKGSFTTDLFIGDEKYMQIFNKLKSFCFKFIFDHRLIIDQEIIGYNIIERLLSEFVPVVLKYDRKEKMNDYENKLLSSIPNSALQLYHSESKGLNDEEKNYYRVKIAIDYICGMTDGFAKKRYNELFGN